MFDRIAVTVVGVAALAMPIAIRAQSPKFEWSSLKPCGDALADRKTGEVFPGGRGGGGRSSPGRLRLDCWTVKDLIQSACVRYANGQDHSLLSVASTTIEGGPDLKCNQRAELGQRLGGIGCWINSDRFSIDAKSEDAPSQETMRGPMMQALLEDRFKLKIHRETREVPVYELTVADGGPKLQPAKEGTCKFVAGATSLVIRTDAMPCAMLTQRGESVTVEAQATSLGELSKLLGLAAAGLDRPVIDKTGITGLFDFHLEYGHPSVTADPSIFTALERLGLKLEQAKGPRQFLVIDHVERPSGN